MKTFFILTTQVNNAYFEMEETINKFLNLAF